MKKCWEAKSASCAIVLHLTGFTNFYTGFLNLLRACITLFRWKHSSVWSLTSPMACINAYAVVGPTNFQPRFFSSFERAIDSGDVDTF